jgi:hypothetical protein
MSLRVRIVLLIALVIFPGLVFSADVVFVDSPGTPSLELKIVEMACDFYGLHLEKFAAPDGTGREALSAFLAKNRPEAIIVSVVSLTDAGIRTILTASRNKDNNASPVLVVDIHPSIDGLLLRELSAGKIWGCERFLGAPQSGRCQFGDFQPVTRHLNRQSYQITLEAADFLSCDPAGRTRDIIHLASGENGAERPVFVMAAEGTREIFFLTRFHLTCPLYLQRPSLDSGRILESLPVLMFLRYACGEGCWQSPGPFANLTIDDPWLREPYGHLRFSSLLAQMEKANFHTTIAFIPWNYDRSEPAVATLFREHPDRFSICLHGNDHDHSEFGDPNSARHREADIKQGLARMEAFTRLTGVGYDPVMVFPHVIARDTETLAALKEFNFLATVNQDNVPLSMPKPKDLIFFLRDVTLDYANFPSVNRAAAYRQTEADIAIDAFLGNPLLFYGHHDLFEKGIDGFNRLAEVVNKLEPSVRWASLGTVSRHLYLTRKREDGAYDVLALCRNIELENPYGQITTFHVTKPESFSFPIRSLTVDGRAVPYEKATEGLSFVLDVPAAASRSIDIEYENGLDLGAVDISKNSNRIRILRKLSDFRDIHLSSFPLGRAIIRFFYGSGAYRYARGRLILFGLVGLLLAALVGGFLVRRIRRRRAQRRAGPGGGEAERLA